MGRKKQINGAENGAEIDRPILYTNELVCKIAMHPFEQKIIAVYGNQGIEWLAELPSIIDSITKDWRLSNFKVIDNLSYNYVLSGFQQNRPIILKIGINQDELAIEVAALKAFVGYGAVKVLHEMDNAVLLERATPGISLKSYSATHNGEYIQICCNVMKKLHKAPIQLTHINQFTYMHDWLTIIDKEWAVPKHYLEKARELKKQLLKTETSPILLHGDLHWENILSNGSDWVVIDPKGVIGAPINV